MKTAIFLFLISTTVQSKTICLRVMGKDKGFKDVIQWSTKHLDNIFQPWKFKLCRHSGVKIYQDNNLKGTLAGYSNGRDIRIATNKLESYRIPHVLLHELLHHFGSGHNGYPIMQEYTASMDKLLDYSWSLELGILMARQTIMKIRVPYKMLHPEKVYGYQEEKRFRYVGCKQAIAASIDRNKHALEFAKKYNLNLKPKPVDRTFIQPTPEDKVDLLGLPICSLKSIIKKYTYKRKMY